MQHFRGHAERVARVRKLRRGTLKKVEIRFARGCQHDLAVALAREQLRIELAFQRCDIAAHRRLRQGQVLRRTRKVQTACRLQKAFDLSVVHMHRLLYRICYDYILNRFKMEDENSKKPPEDPAV